MQKRQRRDRGSGCIRQRDDGRWEGRLDRDLHPTEYFYGKTRKQVENELFLARAKAPKEQPQENLTVGEWLDRWLQQVKDNPKLRPATYKLYKNTVELHIKSHLANFKLDKLTKVHVYNMLDALATEKVGDRTRQMVHSTLHRALQIAFKRDMVARNVVALVDKPGAKKKPRVFLETDEQVEAFRRVASTSDYGPLYMTGLDTGLRLGELTALKWDSLDLPRGLLHVKATLTVDDDGKLVASEPKTRASARTVKLTKNTIELLRQQEKKQLASEQGLTAWVFPNAKGGPLRKDGLMRSDLKEVAKKAGVPGLTFHGLRHSHATMLARLGVGIKVVQERLGHSTSRMTLDVYTHATTTMQDEAVAALDAFHATAESSRKISGQISGQNDKMAVADSNENPAIACGI
jgi:integrase